MLLFSVFRVFKPLVSGGGCVWSEWVKVQVVGLMIVGGLLTGGMGGGVYIIIVKYVGLRSTLEPHDKSHTLSVNKCI